MSDLCSSDLCLAVEKKVAELVLKAQDFFDKTLPEYTLSFALRGKAAGQFRYQKKRWKISECEFRFNASLLQRHGAEFIEDVIPHEVAHFVAYVVYGSRIKPHGPEWKSVMRDVYHATPEVTHRYEVESKPKKTYPYICGCEGKEHALGAIRHNRVQRDSAVYVCRVCKTSLRCRANS